MKIKRNILLLSATELEHGQTYLFDHEIHITGIGKVKAAVETARLINEYKPDIVVNFGSCGAVKQLPIGEVFKVGKVINDIDAMQFSNDKDITLQGKGDIVCCTTDHFYDKSKKYQSPTFYQRNDIDIVDMELYGIAAACKSAQVFCYSYKWVSDDGNIDQWAINAAKGFENFKYTFKDTFL
jgi:adenosylhomocysteine nucleosidase